MEVLSRAPVPGLARGLPADRPPRPLQLLRGVHPHRRLDVQPAREVAQGHARHPLAAADRVAQLPAHARTCGARTTTASPTRTRASSTTSSTRRPRSSACTCRPTRTRLLSVADHCLRSRDYVNVIVAGKQPALNYLSMDDAIVHCTRGIGIWEWASNDDGGEPDVVMACAGDVPTLETLAAAAHPARAPPRPARAGRERRRPDAARSPTPSTRTASPTATSTRCSPPTGRWSSPTTATRG